MHNDGMDKWMTTTELSEYIDMPIATIYAKNSRGEMPPRYRVGKSLRYRLSEVDQWVTSRLVESGQAAHA
jgi:excisionase family DNA binding protein